MQNSQAKPIVSHTLECDLPQNFPVMDPDYNNINMIKLKRLNLICPDINNFVLNIYILFWNLNFD